MLTLDDIEELTRERESAFNPHYWTTAVCDQKHFTLVSNVKQPIDYRLLYDSWLWRRVIDSVRPAGMEANAEILELLPGTSLTVPVALQSVDFKGTLVRMNEDRPVPLSPAFTFHHYWHEGQLAELLAAPLSYDLIVGNHIVDDLLFAIYYPDLIQRAKIYPQRDLCKAAWESMAGSASIPEIQTQIVTAFLAIVRRMPLTSRLVLRHYPSTFALRSRDLARINLEMDTFLMIAKAAHRSDGTASCFLDLGKLDVPAGSQYPNSLLVLSRTSVSLAGSDV
jgi:hypothetical protein